MMDSDSSRKGRSTTQRDTYVRVATDLVDGGGLEAARVALERVRKGVDVLKTVLETRREERVLDAALLHGDVVDGANPAVVGRGRGLIDVLLKDDDVGVGNDVLSSRGGGEEGCALTGGGLRNVVGDDESGRKSSESKRSCDEELHSAERLDASRGVCGWLRREVWGEEREEEERGLD